MELDIDFRGDIGLENSNRCMRQIWRAKSDLKIRRLILLGGEAEEERDRAELIGGDRTTEGKRSDFEVSNRSF